MGDVVLADMLRDKGLFPEAQGAAEVYFQILDESLRQASLSCIQQLRDRNISVEWPMTPGGGNKQFKAAKEAGARYTVTLQSDGSLEVKNLASRETSSMSLDAFAGVC